MAVCYLQVVDAPLGPLLGVDRLVAEGRGEELAGEAAPSGVHLG